MTDTQIIPEAVLELVGPDGSRRVVRVAHTRFLIGRGGETGNHLQVPDRRISRECAALVYEKGDFRLQDRGQRRGLFINGGRVDSRPLRDGDTINFGLPDSYELIFHVGQGTESLPQLLSRMEQLSTAESGAGGLRKLSLLLEATALLHSHLPLDAVLGTMVDHAIALTDADRGLLLEPASTGGMRVRLARQRGARSLPTEGLEPSQTAIRATLEQHRALVTEDVEQAGALDLKLTLTGDIQQALLPREFPRWPHLQVSGINQPCLTVGGDYFDVVELGSNRTAFIIADVSGKGLGAALVTTMLQGALSGLAVGQQAADVLDRKSTRLNSSH